MLGRRLISLPVLAVTFALALALSPLIVLSTVVVDLAVAPRRFPTTRLAWAVGLYLGWSIVAQFRILGIWLRSGLGLRTWAAPTQERYRIAAGWWTQGLIRILGRPLGYRVDVEGLEDLHGGPLIVLPRHVSIFDAFLSPALATEDPAMAVRLVMMRELRKEPSLDLVGHRAPHHFVEREGDDPAAELAAIGALARDMADHVAVVIYPEGGLFRERVRQRLIEKYSVDDPAAAQKARSLRNLLPIRPGGVLRLLREAPTGTDVVLVGHVGFEQLTDQLTLWRNVPLREPIILKVFRYRAHEVPESDDDRLAWLEDRWQELDNWVTEARVARDQRLNSA